MLPTCPLATKAKQVNGEEPLAEEVLDELHRFGVSNELLRDWGEKEAQEWQATASQSSRPRQLEETCHKAAMRFIYSLSQLAALAPEGWQEAALLLDRCYNLGCVETLEDLPAAATALVLLLRKDQCCTTAPRAADATERASQFAKWLFSSGLLPTRQHRTSSSSTECEASTLPAVSASRIVQQEREMLLALGWRVHRPSPAGWMANLCKRLDIISGRRFTHSLSWIFQQSQAITDAMVMNRVLSSEFPPRRLANGLLCLFLIVARMVPLNHMRPAEVSTAEWETLFLTTRLAAGVPVCELKPDTVPALLQFLLRATGCPPQALQDDALAVARAMSSLANAQANVSERQQELQQRQTPSVILHI